MPASWRKVPLPVTESSRDENSLPVLYLHVVFVFTSLVTTACCSHRLVADVRRFFDELMTMKHRQEDRRVLFEWDVSAGHKPDSSSPEHELQPPTSWNIL